MGVCSGFTGIGTPAEGEESEELDPTAGSQLSPSGENPDPGTQESQPSSSSEEGEHSPPSSSETSETTETTEEPSETSSDAPASERDVHPDPDEVRSEEQSREATAEDIERKVAEDRARAAEEEHADVQSEAAGEEPAVTGEREEGSVEYGA